ncbi:uncharacterized protein EI97DRAFT_460819 [Westerdykella ornata]|uniref:Uncharacterized protein n=1 Tax=Westerdykella ornata TaxID=318751 RepID=A0A6A6JDC2_WESOR|nr:uncharacterized protein EI97DRAFT_460819 [Westerdykella ornata]KAF2273626.1 hypothetical protein EI97DRAFT_460819 [Westerdykella ornata]
MAFSRQGQVNTDGDRGSMLLRDSLISLAIAHFGHKHSAMDIQQESYRMYGKVLRQLNEHLDLPDLRLSDCTILTCLICALRELFFPSGPNHFLKHLQGIETMLKLRGAPAAPIPLETLVILHGLRTLSIVSGMFVARPSLFAQEEWKHLQPLQLDQDGRIRHNILPILADCTKFIAARDAVLRSNDPNARRSLLRQIDNARSALDSIRTEWPTNVGLKQTRGRSLGTQMMYNATYICLLDIRQGLEPSLEYEFLRSFAVQEIISNLERLSQKPGGVNFSIIRFVVIQVALHVMGGSGTPLGRQLVRVLQGPDAAGVEIHIQGSNLLGGMGIGQIFP